MEEVGVGTDCLHRLTLVQRPGAGFDFTGGEKVLATELEDAMALSGQVHGTGGSDPSRWPPDLTGTPSRALSTPSC
jgi:hypothetical protein